MAAADGPAKDGNVATKLDLSFGIKLEFFSAMKRAAFQKKAARHSRNLRELIGHEMRRRKMQGKSGKVALIHIPTDAELDAAAGGDIDAPYGAWVITRETSIDPDHPEWFDDCEFLARVCRCLRIHLLTRVQTRRSPSRSYRRPTLV